ncbi:hypothetical protein AG0111_0g9091 [Alternaria gaisen]|uniref:Uncharacterized protein n=1 Tax=Alternaria gaisen TaxID=167740 RepID=A0ACB6FDR3_9PLEO|nr:hypothetical protein AG0111_0g9091 [Alternaria gaisen]
MTVGQARGTASKAKKHSPILQAIHPLLSSSNTNEFRFGGRLLRLHVGPKRRQFSVHEDMLCKQSTFFKNQFQTVRKDVEGGCIICHEYLDALVQTLTYCKTCGNNLHQDCMKQWSENNNTCPTFRSKWILSDFFDTTSLDDMDADGFDVYVQWLYGCTIPVYEAAKGDHELRCFRLILAHEVGETLGDIEFLQVVRQEIIECSLRMTDKSRHQLMLVAYQKTTRSCALRRLFVDLFALQTNYDALKMAETPGCIFRNFVQCLMDRMKAQGEQDVWSFMSAAGHIEQIEDRC